MPAMASKSSSLAADTDVIIEKRHDADGKVVEHNKYAKGKLLGKGGFAKCYVGTSLSSRTNYAIKLVAKSSLVKPRAKQKLQSEIKIHRSLRHVHVVRFERVFEDKHNAYILLELCNNNSMSELMKRRKKVSEPEARFYMSQLINGLKYLHGKAVIHRDLKLGNLFLDAKMWLKMGDFGLATRLTHPSERKRTICGTPNYIAPEILDGKVEGHSFPVDIWSAGVVLYTLLVGKPPFESKDVKSTYKRILANSYSFPDHTPVCASAKALISEMLQHDPSKRPRLDDISTHPFFSAPGVIFPTSMPPSSLREAPVFDAQGVPVGAQDQLYSTEIIGASVRSKTQPNAPAAMPVNDENDPRVINRPTAPVATQLAAEARKASAGSVPVSDRASVASARVGSTNPSTASGFDRVPSRRESSRPSVTEAAVEPTKLSSRSSKAQGALSRPRPLNAGPRSTSRGHGTEQRTEQKQYQQQPQQPQQQLQQQGSKSSSSARFEIFADEKAEGLPDEAASQTSQGTSSTTGIRRTSTSAFQSRQSSNAAAGAPQVAVESNDASGLETGMRRLTVDTNVGDADNDVETMELPTTGKTDKEATSARGPTPVQAWVAGASTGVDKRTPEGAAGKNTALKQPGTLETMHELLTKTISVRPTGVDENAPTNINTASVESLDARWSGAGTATSHEGSFTEQAAADGASIKANTEPTGSGADLWVVRYVDYTSKYGLGFLLNNGSAGVYFNDSTKIVMSPDGRIFQYVERKRRSSGAAAEDAHVPEHVLQRHALDNYPSELNKKVTLLKHFKSYLIEQGSDANANANRENTAQAAASAAAAAAAAVSAGTPLELGEHEPDMPFLKKWVRTKHAILFRLSNRIVQVVFFDRSEILLSSEARIVTYLDKQGARSLHSLDDVIRTGRADIAKRLKYTKDIMYRLISLQGR
jgi:serine/threonine protein kinase